MAATVSVGLAAAGLAAACTSSPDGTTPESGPVRGGTLKLVAASGPDHIDTVPAYYTADYILERAYARQLLTYPTISDPTLNSAGWAKDITPAPDVATAVPTRSNGGITNGGKTYTLHIKQGVYWNTRPPRQVTAADFVREFKAFCNPVSPVGNPLYYTATIAGLKQYCDAETTFFASKKNAPTAANIANFQKAHSISGITAVSPSTITFTLIQPAGDFTYMLAMPFTSARPAEYDKYLPDSLELDQHTISDGPYQITSYLPNRSITMSRNPAWKQSTDPNRHQYVRSVRVTIGVSDGQAQFDGMKTGKYDLPLDTGIVASEIPALEASRDPKFRAWPGSNILPYIVFNLRSPNNRGAMGQLAVRQAIEYGINKVAVENAVGGPAVAKILNTAIPPGNVGYQNYDLYPSTNHHQGDPARCRSMLARAGHKNGLSVRYLYQNDSLSRSIFDAVRGSLRACGINLDGKPESGSTFFSDLGNAPANAKPGTWDMAQTGWFPDWFGNNGRAIIAPMFQTPCVVNTTNYGCYRSKELDSLVKQAESATSTGRASMLWYKADHNVMANAVIVPLLRQHLLMYSSSNVSQAGTSAIVYHPNIGGPDITNVWLNSG
jgi:peptide/nickel transport system substrate-binding protein